jgi:hypothetical protein
MYVVFCAVMQPALAQRLTPFHSWMREHAPLIDGVLTMNIDSLERAALADSADALVLQLHGSIQQCTVLSELEQRAYGSRHIAQHSVWSNLAAVQAISSGAATLSAMLLDATSGVLMLDSSSDSSKSQQQAQRQSARTAQRLAADKQALVDVCCAIDSSANSDSCSSSNSSNVRIDDAKLAAANRHLQLLLPRLLIGNVVFNGDSGAAAVADSARKLLHSFGTGNSAALTACHASIQHIFRASTD